MGQQAGRPAGRERRWRRLVPLGALLAALGVSLLAGCGPDGGGSGGQARTDANGQVVGDPAAGRKLATAACQACHSFDGKARSGPTWTSKLFLARWSAAINCIALFGWTLSSAVP